MDLSKAYDCLPHDLIIAKLDAYGFSVESLNLINSFLSNRKQRVKIGSKFSEWLEIILGVPQGSILGPILFNIFINDLLLYLLETDICNFADDNTIYACDKTLYDVISRLERDIQSVTNWFKGNSMVANPGKFQMMFLGKGTENEIIIEIDGVKITSSSSVRLLGVTLDKNLRFSAHIDSLCKSVNNKTNALLRIRRYIDLAKARELYNTYIISVFNYCCLIWMFCNKKSNDKINRAHKRALGAIYMSRNLPIQDLLSIDGSVSIHMKNLRTLMIEVYKSLNHLNPQFMWGLFRIKETPYDLRSVKNLVLPQTYKKTYGTQALLFRSCFAWNSLPNCIKNSDNISEFKRRIKSWYANTCSCKLCQ